MLKIDKPIAVFASNRHQFEEFIRTHFIFINDIQDLRGNDFQDYINVDNWHDHPDIDNLTLAFSRLQNKK